MTRPALGILAAEAQRFRENTAAVVVLGDMRQAALEAIALCDPTDADAIRLHQATVRAVDEFLARLDAFIRAGAGKGKGGFV